VKPAGRRFGSAPSECGRMAIGGTRRGGGLGVLRKEKGPRWAGAGPQRPGGPECSGGLKQVGGP
jgi:hypothetical protein